MVDLYAHGVHVERELAPDRNLQLFAIAEVDRAVGASALGVRRNGKGGQEQREEGQRSIDGAQAVRAN